MLLAVFRMLVAPAVGGCRRGRPREGERRTGSAAGREAGLNFAGRRHLWRDRPSRASLTALLSCTGLKVPIPTHFQTFLTPKALRPTRFSLIFQRLGRFVKRCCSSRGIAVTISECSGRPSRTPSRRPRHSPSRPNRRASLQGQSFKPKSQRSADVPPDSFVSPPARKAERPEEPRDAPALTPSPILLSGLLQ